MINRGCALLLGVARQAHPDSLVELGLRDAPMLAEPSLDDALLASSELGCTAPEASGAGFEASLVASG